MCVTQTWKLIARKRKLPSGTDFNLAKIIVGREMGDHWDAVSVPSFSPVEMLFAEDEISHCRDIRAQLDGNLPKIEMKNDN